MMFKVVVRLRLPLWIPVLCLALGCATRGTAPMKAGHSRQTDGWQLVSTDPNSGTPALLWNGLIGVRIGPDGSGFDLFGNELPCFAIDAYEQGDFEKIVPMRGLLGSRIESASSDLFARGEDDKAAVRDYSQSLDMRSGLLTTKWREDASTELYPERSTDAQVETVMHPTLPVVAQRFTLRQTREPYFLVYQLQGEGAPEESFRSRLTNPREVEARLALPADKVVVSRIRAVTGEAIAEANEWSATVGVDHGEGESAVIERIAWLVDASAEPSAMGFEDVAKASRAAWAERWKTDIEIDGPIEDQLAVRSWLFYLRSAIHPDGNMSISPMGLSSSDYNGHVFWDADLWVFPALALIDPEAARKIPDYRIARSQQYQKNWIEWMKHGNPNANGPTAPTNPDGGKLDSSDRGLKVPWESSVSGQEVSPPGQWRFQDHITGTTAFALDMASWLGLCDGQEADQFRKGAQRFFMDRAPSDVPDGQSEMRGTMSPDEHHIANNDLYTNLVAQWCFNGGNWNTPDGRGLRMKLPRDDKGFLTYDDDPIRSYKQAAAVLAIYPLQYPPAEAEARQMMERFADKVTPNGPAMSDAIHATIWARLGETDKAYEAWRKSWNEFARPPHLLFSETRARDETYFTTGAGGCLQTVLNGFLGFRIDSEVQPGAAWSRQLKGDRWLSAKPQLPKAWKRVTIRNFSVLGKRATLTATSEGVEATRGE